VQHSKHEVILRLGQKRTQSSFTGKLHNGPKCGEKHEVAEGLGKKRRQSSFTVNAQREGGRTLIKILWPWQISKTKLLTLSTALAPQQEISFQPKKVAVPKAYEIS
jgi:hypothetical protein